MASAAYYLAAGATAIVASASAEVGSIGVYIPWVDASVAIAAQGLRPDPIVNTGGDLKAIGFGGTLTAEQRAHLQARVDEDFAAFKAHIRDYRDVPDSAMRGQTVSGPAAHASNLIDLQGDESAARTLLLSLIK
jgi:ClpP class serine protease